MLAKQNNISVEKVVEHLIMFYFENTVIDELTPEEEVGLQEAVEESEAPDFDGYSSEEVGLVIEKLLVEYV